MKFQVWRSDDGSEESMFSPEGLGPEAIKLLTWTNDVVPVPMKLIKEFTARDAAIASKMYKRWRGGRFAQETQ